MTPRTDFTGELVDLHQARGLARVSDSALISYLRTVYGVPVDQIRASMLSDTVLQAMALDATSVRGDGFTLVLDNFTVVTTLQGQTLGAITPARRRMIER